MLSDSKGSFAFPSFKKSSVDSSLDSGLTAPFSGRSNSEEQSQIDYGRLEKFIEKTVSLRISQAKVDLSEISTNISYEFSTRLERNTQKLDNLHEFCKKMKELVEHLQSSAEDSLSNGQFQEKMDEMLKMISANKKESEETFKKMEGNIQESLDNEEYSRVVAIEKVEKQNKIALSKTLESALTELRKFWDSKIKILFEDIVPRVASLEANFKKAMDQKKHNSPSDKLLQRMESLESHSKDLEAKMAEMDEILEENKRKKTRKDQNSKNEQILAVLKAEMKEEIKRKLQMGNDTKDTKPLFEKVREEVSEVKLMSLDLKEKVFSMEREMGNRIWELRKMISESEKRSKHEFLSTFGSTHCGATDSGVIANNSSTSQKTNGQNLKEEGTRSVLITSEQRSHRPIFDTSPRTQKNQEEINTSPSTSARFRALRGSPERSPRGRKNSPQSREGEPFAWFQIIPGQQPNPTKNTKMEAVPSKKRDSDAPVFEEKTKREMLRLAPDDLELAHGDYGSSSDKSPLEINNVSAILQGGIPP